MFFYIVVLIVCIVLANIANNYNNRKIACCIALLLSIISGFRGNEVGIDTVHIIDRWDDVEAGRVVYLEYGFTLLIKFLQYFTNDWTYLFFICAVITCYLIILRLWDFRKISSFPIMVAVFYMLYFLRTMNITRQFVAIAIVFYFSRYFFRKKYISYIIGVIIASLFHISSLMAFAIFALDFFKWKELKFLHKVILSICVLCIPLLAMVAENIIDNEFGVYFLNEDIKWGLMTLVKLVFLVLSCYLSKLISINSFNQTDGNNFMIRCCIYIYAAALFLQSLGYIYPFMDRIGLLFNMFGVVYWGILFKTKIVPNKIFYAIIFLLLIVYPFIGTLLYDSYGVIPYNSSW